MALTYLSLMLLAAAQPAPTGVGQTIAELALPDCHGKAWTLPPAAERPLVVVAFVGPDCPIARLYAGRLGELAGEFGPRGVAFVGVASNPQDTPPALARYAATYRVPFPILMDQRQVAADRFGATRTIETFILDRQRVVRYRGRVDDQYDRGIQRADAGRRHLAAALEELLAGKAVSQPVTEAPGCLIGRDKKPAEAGPVTYTRDIAPLLNKHCVSCHRPGQATPFVLTSYKAAAGWAETAKEAIDAGRMPPWHADPRHGKFANERRLSAAEKQLFSAWIAAGLPRGDEADLPPPPVFPDGWNIPQPDLVLAIPETITIPATGAMEYQYVAVDPGFREDRWVQAVEVRPSNPIVVHHVNVNIAPPGMQFNAKQVDFRFESLLPTARGNMSLTLPPGMAKRIPAGWHIYFEIHYTPIGSVQTDRTTLGLLFAEPGTVKKEVRTCLLIEKDLRIPPRTPDHRVEKTWVVEQDALVLALFPHMHLRGKSFRYEATYPDGASEILLEVPAFDFNWQHRYTFAEPKRLPAGTVVKATAVYDNSAATPANPDPDATVSAGTQTWEEMFNGYLELASAEQDMTAPQHGPLAWLTLLAAGIAALGLWLRRCARPAPTS